MARSYEETNPPRPGRSAYQSAQPIGETPLGTMDQPVGSGDNWGYQPKKRGVSLEARLGMFIIVILLGAFAFLVYRKFDQHQLLAGENHAPPTEAANNEANARSTTPAAADNAPVSSSPTEFPRLTQLHVAHDSDLDEDLEPGGSSPVAWPAEETADVGASDDEDPFAGLLDLPADDSLHDPENDDAFSSDERHLAAREPLADEPFTNTPGVAAIDDDPFIDLNSDPQEVTQPEPSEEPADAFGNEADRGFVGEPLPYADEVVLNFDDGSADFDEFSTDEPEGTSFDMDLVAADDDFQPPVGSLDAPPAHSVDFPPIDDQGTDDSFSDDADSLAIGLSVPEPSPSSGPPPDLGESPVLDDLLLDDFAHSEPVERNAVTLSPEPSLPQRSGHVAADEEPGLLIPHHNFQDDVPSSRSAQFDSPELPDDSNLLANDDQHYPRPVPQRSANESTIQSDGFFPDEESFTTDRDAQDDQFADTFEVPEDALPNAFTKDYPLSLPMTSTGQNSVTEHRLPANAVRRSPASPVSSRVVTASAEQDPCDIIEVEPNDNYWKISRRAYGTTRYFAALARYNQNRITNPRHLRPGMKVLVPAAEVLEDRYPKLFRSTQPAEPKKTGYFVQSDGSAAYRIGDNDTLSNIAEKHLGRSSRWIEIYQSNRNVLENPNRLKPGTVIALPDDATDVHVIP